jgi:hypothetical protein
MVMRRVLVTAGVAVCLSLGTVSASATPQGVDPNCKPHTSGQETVFICKPIPDDGHLNCGSFAHEGVLGDKLERLCNLNRANGRFTGVTHHEWRFTGRFAFYKDCWQLVGWNNDLNRCVGVDFASPGTAAHR